MSHLNLSFSACGFLGIYHIGAASALLKHGQKLLQVVKCFAGASAGSLVATVLLTAPDKMKYYEQLNQRQGILSAHQHHILRGLQGIGSSIQEVMDESEDFIYQFSEDVRKQKLGAATPGYNFMSYLREGIETILPANAHKIAKDRLYISITNARSRQNCLVSSFASREELVKVLLASSFVPLYAGVNAVEFKGEKWFDGGFTNSLPILPTGRTITVSPFSDRQDICPKDKEHMNLYFKIGKQDVLLSAANFKRLNQGLFPPSRATMESIFQDGYNDAFAFFHSNNWHN